MPRSAVLCAAAVLAGLTGCVLPPTPIYVGEARPPGPPPQVVVSYPPVPAPRVEIIPPPPPRREYVVWEPGQWHWNGYTYQWIAGHYVERHVGVTRWEPGRWVPRRGGYGWIPGHWV